MIDWWQQFIAKWDWTDPMLLLSLITAVVTALIPVFLWRLDSKQAKRQVQILEKQKQVLAKGRRDELLKVVYQSSDKAHLELLWEEVGEYEGKDQKLLKRTFRTNPVVALPGNRFSLENVGLLDQVALDDYMLGLERRYSVDKDTCHPYGGLLDFIELAAGRGLEVDASVISLLVTGQTAELQKPGSEFYRDLVRVLPSCASGILYRVEAIDYITKGGLRINVLAGVLLGVKGMELGRQSTSISRQAISQFCSEVSGALGYLLHRDNLRSFDHWSLEGSSEPVSATVAWLVRAVGWLADSNPHNVMRMVQNLPAAIASIPPWDRGWGIDDADVRQGFKWIEEKRPDLWSEYGGKLEEAADVVGDWRC